VFGVIHRYPEVHLDIAEVVLGMQPERHGYRLADLGGSPICLEPERQDLRTSARRGHRKDQQCRTDEPSCASPTHPRSTPRNADRFHLPHPALRGSVVRCGRMARVGERSVRAFWRVADRQWRGTIDSATRRMGSPAARLSGALVAIAMTGIEAATSPPPLPRWFGPRASPDDPAVSALIDRVARGAGWVDIGGDFNLNVRIDAEPPVVLRVHRPRPRRGRVAGLRRLRERLQGTQVRVARPIPISGGDLLRVADRWAELEEFIDHVQPQADEDSYVRRRRLGRAKPGLPRHPTPPALTPYPLEASIPYPLRSR
jgi:hypothetical protein